MAGGCTARLAVIGSTSIPLRKGGVTIAGHPSKDIDPKTLRSVLIQAGLNE